MPVKKTNEIAVQNNNENEIFLENAENENNPALCSSHEFHNNHQNEQYHYHIESSDTNKNNSNSKDPQNHRYQTFQKLHKAKKLEMVEQEGDEIVYLGLLVCRFMVIPVCMLKFAENAYILWYG